MTAPVTALRTVVFVGPSFPRERVRELAPSAEVRPPIRRGDLSQIEAPAIIAIIDGTLELGSAITTREIRAAIARGIRVAGASGIGALRAVEVPEMFGFGRVYEMYKNGELQRDDEVAVLVDSDGSHALTEALVNIRFAVDTLVRSGTIDAPLGASIVEAASILHFHDRSYSNIFHKAGLEYLRDGAHLISILRSIDLKREDAQTLLEHLDKLDSEPRRSQVDIIDETQEQYHDHGGSRHFSETEASDAPVLVWEFGEQIEWQELFAFLAATGGLDAHGRRVLARAPLKGQSQSKLDSAISFPSVQELFKAVMREWDWNAAEEVYVTLKDLGIGFNDLQAQLLHERNLQKELVALSSARNEAFIRALRCDLFMTDISLKREVMRLGALRALARESTVDITESDLLEAKRALLCARPELTWEGILNEGGVQEPEVQGIVAIVAKARRTGIPLLRLIANGPAARGEAGLGTKSLPEVMRTEGSSSRSIEDREAASIARRLGRVIGVTRVAQLGELGRFGLHVASAYRPSTWSSTIGSGKSESLDGAVVGALMEELEKYCQECFEPDCVTEASFRDVERDQVVDPLSCALPFDSSYDPALPLRWSWMLDLHTGRRVLVPLALLSMRRERNDLLYSPRRAARVFNTNGLGSSFTITEALVHALCERVERHAMKLAEQLISNPGQLGGVRRWPFDFIDLNTCPASTQHILTAIRQAGYEARVMDVTCEVGVPTFSARIFKPAEIHGMAGRYSSGSCTHVNAERAINRTLLEAVQMCISAISGAREDFGIKARSLGRHERPRPLSRGDAYWIRPYVPKKPLSKVCGLVTHSAREELEFVVRRITAAGFDRVLYRDMSRAEVAPAQVVRAFVPGMEDTNPFHTGLRARALMVQDLLQQHEW